MFSYAQLTFQARGYETLFMLNSGEYEVFSAYKHAKQ